LKPQNSNSAHGARVPESDCVLLGAEAEALFSRFNLLIDELTTGKIRRNKFEPWEIDFLLDALDYGLTRPCVLLSQYREAVRRQLANGVTVPMKLSEFLVSRKKRARMKSTSV